MSFKRVLVANRGEIAVRVIRALKSLNISSAAVYSDADVTWPHPAMADISVRLSGNYPAETYLNIEKIITAAKASGCDAIHPGYGFLSESRDFSLACRENGLKFIGPSPEALLVSGNKLECKRLAESVGVPVVPYTRESLDDPEQAVKTASEIGFPVLLKSAFGGGGRGIREAKDKKDVQELFSSAQREAKASFGRFSIFIEKRLIDPRHIEVQVIASDDSSEFVHLGERDCSIQRRYQKLVEMSPSPVVDEEAREKIATYALKIARATRYSNAGTAEFLRDSKTGDLYFMEVNSRLQVEHPVTELVTGIDVVETQIKIASETRIPFKQEDVQMNGCAIECRINAEDPSQNFAPITGTIDYLSLPGGPGIRVDTAVQPGVEISPYYDSLVAKLLAHGRDFDQARVRLLGALDEFVISGIETTIPFHRAVLQNARFMKGDFDTGFLSKEDLSSEIAPKITTDHFVMAALLLSKTPEKLSSNKRRQTRTPHWISNHRTGRFIDGL